MNDDLDFFKQFLFEAPGDDPPPDIGNTGPPEMPDIGDDYGGMAPDMPDTDGGSGIDTGPPDMPDDDFMAGDMGDDMDDGSMDGDGGEEQDPNETLELDEKISAIMNQTLYQRFLQLVGNVSSQISQMKTNSDMMYAITPKSVDFVENLTKLSDNIRLYLKYYFMNENYSKNLLFFNKCINLLSLLNQSFDGDVKKGIKSMDT